MWETIGGLFSGAKDWIGSLFSAAPEQLAGPAAETAGSGLFSGFGDAASGVASAFGDVASGLGGVAKSILPAAQLGAAGLGAYSSMRAAEQAAEQNRIARAGQQMAERALAPVTAYGEEALARAEGGEIPEAQQAEIDQWVAGAKQQARDYLARAGQGDSSALRDWEDWIDQRAVAMKNSALQAMTGQGIEALTGSATGGNTIAQGATGRGDALQNLIAQANAQIARLGGSQAA